MRAKCLDGAGPMRVDYSGGAPAPACTVTQYSVMAAISLPSQQVLTLQTKPASQLVKLTTLYCRGIKEQKLTHPCF